MSKRYFYFVSYYYSDDSYFRNIGCAEVVRDEKIDSFADINAVSDAIMKKNGYEHRPTILNFTLLRTEQNLL